MNLSFDDLTSQISNAQLDIRTFEAERIKRKLSQNFNAYQYESRLRNRLENLMLEIGEDVIFPWNFNHDFQPEPIKNLSTFYAIENIIDKHSLEKNLQQFIRGIVEKDYTRVKEVSEEHLVSSLRRNLKKAWDIEVGCSNLASAKFDFEIFNISNYFTVDIEQNRRKNFFFDKCKIFDEEIDGVLVKNLIPKRLSKDPVAKLFVQFDVNLTTDLDIYLKQEGKEIRRDSMLQTNGSATHKLKVEVLLAQSNYRSLLNTGLDEEIVTFKNFISEPDIKIVDIDGFMKGNPLLKGMM